VQAESARSAHALQISILSAILLPHHVHRSPELAHSQTIHCIFPQTRELNSFGIVGVVEPGIDERGIALYRAVHDTGQMTVRTDVLYRAMLKADVEKGMRQSSRIRTATCCASWESSFR
jgi:predicted amidohydrolase YtcJ